MKPSGPPQASAALKYLPTLSDKDQLPPSLSLVATPKPTHARRVQVDAFRGVGVILMLAFHLLFDLRTFCSHTVTLALPQFFWRWAPVPIGSIFLFVVGWTIHLQSQKTGSVFQRALLRRVGKVLGIALIITAVTVFVTPAMPVYFGILHCIGASELLVYPLRRSPHLCGILGIIVITTGFYFLVHKSTFGLSLLGVMPLVPLDMGDYYPLLPFTGFVLLGLCFGHIHETVNGNRLPRQLTKNHKTTRFLAFLGRHSLGIYLLNQPIFIGMLFALGLASF